MKATFEIKILKNLLLVVFLLLTQVNVLISEGTKQFRPTSSDYGNLQINDQGRPFALESNSDPLHRLYFHISNTNEKVYFGFQHVGSGSSTFRIKDPAGNVVYARTSVPSSGTGYISTYDQAVAGPKISGSPANGYNPFLFTPATTGDFYIEFTTTLSSAYHFDLFDLTVVNADNVPIPGRLWSYAWDLNTRSYDNRYNGSFYVYTDDGYVAELDMNGIQPYGFVISCNSTGPGNTPYGNNENRKSVAGNSTRPQYKIFLNDPDSTVYPSGQIPQIIQNLQVIGTPYYQDTVLFAINMSVGGTVEMIIDLNGIPGYQSGTKDVIMVQYVNAGPDTIMWDGKDGFGNYVDASTPVVVITSSFASGVTHFPLYDPETHLDGYIVNRIRPMTGQAQLYWDDSNFSGGTVNVDGSLSNGHSWSTNFGDVRTMNTWWEGYRLPILNNFQFELEEPLPIELIDFNAILKDGVTEITWKTATETNNDYFTVERSSDAVNFHAISTLEGAHNSNSVKNYQVTDDNPLKGISYYRLKQIDFDGKYTYSNIAEINNSSRSCFEVYPNPVICGYCLHVKQNYGKVSVNIYDEDGKLMRQTEKKDEFDIQIDLPEGLYFIKVSNRDFSEEVRVIVQ